MKLFFKLLRMVLIPFMLLWARFGAPSGLLRAQDAQSKIDLACSKFVLYHFSTCPFCIKVRHEMARLSLPISLRDAQHDHKHKTELMTGGGKVQTPCLRIEHEHGNVEWLYESRDIIQYLRQQFA